MNLFVVGHQLAESDMLSLAVAPFLSRYVGMFVIWYGLTDSQKSQRTVNRPQQPYVLGYSWSFITLQIVSPAMSCHSATKATPADPLLIP